MPAAHPARARLLAAATLLAVAVAGCGGKDPNAQADTLPRTAVSGTVSIDGKPLPAGKIQFNPAEPAPNLVSVSGEVKEGKFAIAQPQGPVPGKYKVSISGLAFQQVAATEEPGPLPKRQVDPVPAKYNTKTTLLKEITATTTAADLDFALTSK